MAITLANIELPADTWVNLYTESGLPVGEPIEVQNLGVADVYLTVFPFQPTSLNAYRVLQRYAFLKNQLADPGAWAYSPQVDGKVNVREAL